MSSLKDLFGFEAFNLKDMWKGIKKDPERLLLGAVDPLSTKMWNGVLGKDYEPLVDQMGGPYGGHTLSAFGNTDGGVYGRAEEAGIDTNAGRNMNNLAHVMAAMLAGNYFMGQMPQGQGQGQFNQFPGQQQQQPQPNRQRHQDLYLALMERQRQRQKEEELRAMMQRPY